jgi:hypothetical protein
VNTCISTTQVQIDDCDTQDYECLCHAWEAQLTCWNNCPDSNLNSGAASSVTSYCGAFSA